MPPTIQGYLRTALLSLLASMVLGVLVQLDRCRGRFGWGRYAGAHFLNVVP